MKSFEVLRAVGPDGARWRSIVDRLPDDLRDVHYLPAYGRVQSSLGIDAVLAVYYWDDDVIVQPFAKRLVGVTGYKDLANLYGYGGPVSTIRGAGMADVVYRQFEGALRAWAAQENIVTEHCALHPMLLENQLALLRGASDRSKSLTDTTKRVVVIDVSGTDVNVVHAMREDRRNNLNRARRDKIMGFTAVPHLNIRHFSNMYAETMVRKNASGRWHYPPQYFGAHFDQLYPDNAALVLARNEIGTVVSGAIVIFWGRVAYYHFAGSIEKAPYGAAEALVMQAVSVARNAGCSRLHLGGGVTEDKNDPLFHFKSGFSPLSEPVMRYGRIFNEQAYAGLCNGTYHPTWFPSYRAGEAA